MEVGPQQVSAGKAVRLVSSAQAGGRWLLFSPSSRVLPTVPAPGLRAASSAHAQSEGSRLLGAEAPHQRRLLLKGLDLHPSTFI